MGQAVVWYTGQFYALFFLTQTLKVDGATANILIAVSLVLATPFFIFFGMLSDKIGRKWIILGGCLIAALTYFPIFERAHPLRQPGAGKRTEELASGGRRRPGNLPLPVQPDRHRRSSRRPATSPPAC